MNRPGGAPFNRHVASGITCCDPQWESAYERFETPEQEVLKFIRRLEAMGISRQLAEDRLVELFCGRGGGLVALERLGFRNLEGVDLSESLLHRYSGPAQLHLADCRQLPQTEASVDGVIVQGGLHHLATLPDDLERVVDEIIRVLKPEGIVYIVEPWATPFLDFVHAIVRRPWVRRIYRKGDALATMIDRERETYDQWLGRGDEILDLLNRHFTVVRQTIGWGKLNFVGRPRRDRSRRSDRQAKLNQGRHSV